MDGHYIFEICSFHPSDIGWFAHWHSPRRHEYNQYISQRPASLASHFAYARQNKPNGACEGVVQCIE